MKPIIDDEFEDYFEDESVPTIRSLEETPEEREEREIKEATIERRRNKLRIAIVSFCFALVLVGFIWAWMHFLVVQEESSARGVVTKFATRGPVIDTFEGDMLTQQYFEKSKVSEADFKFSVKDEKVAKTLYKVSGTGDVVRIVYNQYGGVIPWRGKTRYVVTKVEEVDSVPTEIAPLPADSAKAK